MHTNYTLFSCTNFVVIAKCAKIILAEIRDWIHILKIKRLFLPKYVHKDATVYNWKDMIYPSEELFFLLDNFIPGIDYKEKDIPCMQPSCLINEILNVLNVIGSNIV